MPAMHARPRLPPRSHRSAAGLTLIELLMFIMVVGLALAAVLQVFALATKSSADPQVQRQALAIAESLLQEVQLQPFTFCDPDDANVATATNAAVGAGTLNCATQAESAMGPEAGETRSGVPQFDNVNDYHGFSMNGIADITGTAVTGLADYNVSVTVAPAGLGGVAAGDALRITVTVTGPGSTSVTLQGYRTRHAPNAA
ncbi:type II secretion system protein [Pelomonas sp. APW6]|uniref:Type II secretion system protein n=1 Tax=Roseateles subflavus TaxID=3053353 RepID=A0ABT7LQ25_9BURK|nr:type II secretion system protein [Pelomonas sp. APW6]MDL5034524.1 type II secretion system protein [Pelomonas sp. APW6]